jgi:hypothetical protein
MRGNPGNEDDRRSLSSFSFRRALLLSELCAFAAFCKLWRIAVEVKEEETEGVSAVASAVVIEAAVEIGDGAIAEVGVVVPSAKRRRNGCRSLSWGGW